MGTVAYMSPEQARGEEVDARSDQFSFGLLVYEMAAGKRAFVRPSAAETMAAIIREEAAPLPPSVPAPLRWVVERCLAKDPAERYDSTRDLYRELKLARERLSEASASVQVQAAVHRPRWRGWGAAAFGALAIAAVSFAAARILWRTPEPPVWSGIMLGGSEIALFPRLSPDGHLLAFEAMVDGTSHNRGHETGIRQLVRPYTKSESRTCSEPQLVPGWNPNLLRPLYGWAAGDLQRAGVRRRRASGCGECLFAGTAAGRKLTGGQAKRRRAIPIASLLARNRPPAGASDSHEPEFLQCACQSFPGRQDGRDVGRADWSDGVLTQLLRDRPRLHVGQPSLTRAECKKPMAVGTSPFPRMGSRS